MYMTREKLEKLAETYQAKADKAYMNYQETGASRYDREYRNNEDLAEALRMAARSADDFQALVDMRITLSQLGDRARRLSSVKDSEEAEAFRREVVSAARIRGLIREG